jgi:hypothetical protein
MAAMRNSFADFNHNPSTSQWTALTAIVRTLAEMAVGICPPAPHLTSLDPGVGKTEALMHFIRALPASPDYRDVGVLVCIQRREQIKDIISAGGLSNADFAAYTSDDNMNALGCGSEQRHKARVLFTTHAMLERRLTVGGSFAKAGDFHFQGRPRAVRAWDEALLPGRELTLSRRDIPVLVRDLGRNFPSLASGLERFADQLKGATDGSQIEIPDFGLRHGVSLSDAVIALNGKADGYQLAETLWSLFGRVVTVRRDGDPEIGEDGERRRGNTLLDYRETLPDDLWPVLILDASGRVRTLYRLWEERRGGLIRLPDGPKSYKGHTIHIWTTAGSKGVWRKREKALPLIEGIVATIQERPREKWLVVVHKPENGFNAEVEIRRLLPPKAQVSFITWGRHDFTNTFAAVPNVVLAGTLFYPPSLLEARGRCAAGFPSSAGIFTKADIGAVEIGESHHLILQAMCRGAVRRCEGGGCPQGTHTYIIASSRSRVEKTISRILPEAATKRWEPGPIARVKRKALKGQSARVLAAVRSVGTTLAEIITKSGLPRSTVEPILSRLLNAGRIMRPLRGTYRRC